MDCTPQQSVLELTLFSIFNNDINSGIEFVNATKLGGVVDPLEGQDAMQRNLDRL